MARRLREFLRPPELRSEWFPAPAVKTLAETGAPIWAVEVFDPLRAANGGTLSGFFDVFAGREPGQVRFCEAKVCPDRVKPTQLRSAGPGRCSAGSPTPAARPVQVPGDRRECP